MYSENNFKKLFKKNSNNKVNFEGKRRGTETLGSKQMQQKQPAKTGKHKQALFSSKPHFHLINKTFSVQIIRG